MFEDTDTVLAAYNAGAGRVQEWLADSTCSSDGKTLHTIPYAETEEYVRKVRKAQEMYRKLYEME